MGSTVLFRRVGVVKARDLNLLIHNWTLYCSQLEKTSSSGTMTVKILGILVFSSSTN